MQAFLILLLNQYRFIGISNPFFFIRYISECRQDGMFHPRSILFSFVSFNF